LYQGTPYRRAEISSRKECGFSRCIIVPVHATPLLRKVIAERPNFFFVTSSIAGKENLLQSDRSAGLFIRVLYSIALKADPPHEFVVMSDHFHLLLTVN
jgi:hypothetical protein